MKKLISIALSAAMLISATASVISGEEGELTLRSVSPMTVDRESGYVVTGAATAGDILRNFENNTSVTITDGNGKEIDLADPVGSDYVMTYGKDSLKLAVYGDTNGDGKINTTDSIVLLRKMAGWDVNYCEIAADVNCDTKMNTTDAVLLLRKMAGWDVDLGNTVKAEVAENEDSTIQLYFDSIMNRICESDTESTGNSSYTVKMAKNEIETLQIIFSSESDRTGMSLEMTPFDDGQGNTLECEMLYGYYYPIVMFNYLTGGDIYNTNQGNYVDPLPKLENPFDLRANCSKTFAVKIKTTADSKEGLYRATVNLKDSEGKTVKTATVYTYVWNFALDETPASATAFGTGYYVAPRSDYSSITADDVAIWYGEFYDYLLDNKVSAYHLPYSITDPRADKYLNDPRMTSFATFINGYGGVYQKSDAEVVASYEKLRQNPEWLKKAYIYPVDEPTGEGIRLVREAHEKYTKLIPEDDFKIMVPLAVNNWYNSFEGFKNIDSVEYLWDYIDIWCPQSYAFTNYYTSEERKADPTLVMPGTYGQGGYGPFWTTKKMYDKYGQFQPRYEQLRSEGKTMWWYVCVSPEYPYLNFFQSYQGVNVRGLFWQQYMYNVNGFLYYATNIWEGVSKRRTNNGDGLLLYYGELFGQERGPVTSIRFESVRDGIEDFQYLTQYERSFGRDESMKYVNQFSTAILKYSEDYKLVESLRTEVGDRLEKSGK